MESAKVMIDLDNYEISENEVVSYSEDVKLERLWKIRVLSTKRQNHNDHDSGRRATIKNLSVQGGPIPEDKMDQDYRLFLVEYIPEEINAVRDGNIDGSGTEMRKGSKRRYETRENGSDSAKKQLKFQKNLEASLISNNNCYTETKGSKQRDETPKH